MRKLKGLPWYKTNYNLNLESNEDNAYYQKLVKTDPAAAQWLLNFWIDSNTNNPVSDWGKKRRNARRYDAFNLVHETINEEYVNDTWE